jgi:hypothetical protein
VNRKTSYPSNFQAGVASAILLECGSCPMRLPAVGRDDQALRAPEEVHEEAIDLDVHLGREIR